MPYYPRTIEEKIKASVTDDKIIILTGMRRVGKTTLFRQIANDLENKVFFDFENPLDSKLFEDVDYNDVFERIIVRGGLDRTQRINVFIDEVQLYPGVSRVAKYLHDHYNIKFFLTGSASYYLKNLFPETLAGRKVIFELFPLSFEEFLLFRGVDIEHFHALQKKHPVSLVDFEIYDALYEEYVRWGGFPEVVLATTEEKKRERAEGIFTSYYQKEVVQLGDWSKKEQFRDLIILLASRVGSRIDPTKLASELGITRVTLLNYVAFLEATYFVSFASRFSRNKDVVVSGSKKAYVCDNGIMRVIAETSVGMQIENAVFHQLSRQQDTTHLYYFQTERGNGIDFVVNGTVGYEVKQTATQADVASVRNSATAARVEEVVVLSKRYVENQEGIRFAQFV
ncbi:MAG: ATP-binding protein [bacterium]|nr:ATP-binding protein [bacterium]